MPETPDFDLCRTCGAWRSAHKAGLQDPLTAHDFAEPRMPETPDFEKMARDLVDAYNPEAMADRSIALDVAEQLRLVWNARGAADLATLEALMFPVDDGTNLLPGAVISFELFERALRTLDR